MKTESVSNFKKALFTLLYDQSDSGDLEVRSSDETYIDYIINMLIEKNENTCPFKNYDCIGHCKENHIGCVEGLNIDCNREHEYIWKDFIGIESENVKLIRKDGKEYGLKQVEFCPHCGKMICPDIIGKMFECNFCHHCGGKIEY